MRIPKNVIFKKYWQISVKMCLKVNSITTKHHSMPLLALVKVLLTFKNQIRNWNYYSNPNKEMEINNSFDSFKMSRTIVFKFRTVNRSMLNLFETKLGEC